MLLVLSYHAKAPLFRGGYLGVDIFFVISGFLITGLIGRGIDAGTFSVTRFYWRRAWRLLPALYVVVAVCVVLSPFVLTSIEMHDFVKQVAGTVTFTGNIALWLQTGYFAQAAELKPLLHVWSLAIEEQYYLVIPAALIFLPKRLWLGCIFLATVASIAICFLIIGTKPGAAFYLLPTRAWELGIGSFTALVASRFALTSTAGKAASYAALFTIAYLTVRPMSATHPGIDALCCCVATATLLLHQLRFLNEGVIARSMAWVGDRSYSIYLVHWPLFAFLNSANLSGGTPWTVRLGTAVVALLLAWILHRYVEQPCRAVGHASPSLRRTGLIATLSFVILCSAWLIERASVHSADYANRLRSNRGLDFSCASDEKYVPLDACKTSPNPKLLVWGDSFAMHLLPGLAALPNEGLAQATRDACAPLLGLALFAPPAFSEARAKSCIAFNQTVLGALTRELASTETVVLSSPWIYLLDSQLLDGKNDVIGGNAEVVGEALLQTVGAIRALGKRVVIVAPPPNGGFDMGRCNERLETGKVSFGATSDCNFRFDTYKIWFSSVRTMLDMVKAKGSVEIIWYDEVMCDLPSNTCKTKEDRKILYTGGGHLSYEGSRWS